MHAAIWLINTLRFLSVQLALSREIPNMIQLLKTLKVLAKNRTARTVHSKYNIVVNSELSQEEILLS